MIAVSILLITAIGASKATPAWSATPIGTLIENTGQATYSVSGISGFNINSNTEQFAVEGLGQTDSAVINVVQIPLNPTPCAGDTLTFDITIVNSGDNTLANSEFSITAPRGSTIDLSTGTLLNTVDVNDNSLTVPATIHTYSEQDILSFETFTLQAVITLPLDVTQGDTDITFELAANGGSITISHNSVTIQGRTDGVLELMRYDADSTEAAVSIQLTQYDNGSSFVTIAPPTLPDNSSVSVTDQPLPLSVGRIFSHGQTLFFRVTDPDQNFDPNVRDTIEIDLATSDTDEGETLLLSETTINSGIFTGYITLSAQAGASNDGTLSVSADSLLTASYVDNVDSSDSSISVALVDPYGVIFDSATGALLDGFTVRLVNAATEQDAVVYGDDGVSIYDSTVTSGGTASDSSGKTYDFPSGAYRFPFIAPGKYYLEITPPADSRYNFPSEKTNDQLADLPNGPFALGVGSRGEIFTIIAGPPLHLDIPADPISGTLFIRRTASKEEVAQGEFMQFRISIENTSEIADVAAVMLMDTLPQGFVYQNGSARLDNARIAGPRTADDGRNLTFPLGTVNAGTTREISYVVSVGAAKSGIAESSSIGTGDNGAVTSNVSTVRTRVKEAFMRDHNILMGRVAAHDEDGSPGEEGIAGVRIYLEDGTYTITDERGRYHFEGVRPGTHVVQLDIDTLPGKYEVIPFVKNTRFAGRAWSQFVDLQGGTLWRVDFHAALKPAPKGHLRLQLSSDEQSVGDQLRYRIKLQNKTVPLSNLKLMLMLPENIVYQTGSSSLGNSPIPAPEINDNVLTFRLPDVPGDCDKDLIFNTRITNGKTGELITKAMLIFDTQEKKNQRSTIIEHRLDREVIETGREVHEFVLRPQFAPLSIEIKKIDSEQLDKLAEQLGSLENIHITAVGHTDNRKIRPKSRIYFPDNLDLSEQRALAVANYLRDKLTLTPERIVAAGRGSAEPIAGNITSAGRARNRRVELLIRADKVKRKTILENTQTAGSTLEISTAGTWTEKDAQQAEQPVDDESPTKITYDEIWLSTAAPGIEWLSPADNDLPAIPSVTVAIKHGNSHNVKLFLNNKPVPEVNFDGTAKNRAGTSLSRWSGVDLIEGDNLFEAVILNSEGLEKQRLSRRVHYSAPPVHAALVKEQSVLKADGITPPVITVRLTDKYGYPARRDTIAEYQLMPPYRPSRENEKFDTALLPGSPERRLKYKVSEDGLASIKLEPTTESGEVHITLPLMSGEQIVKARLTAPTRDWIIVGFAEGTVGYNTLSGQKEDLSGNAAEEHLYDDGQIAFFAKGRIKGKWLLTIAYDSDKEDLSEEKSLFQTIDPGTYYTVYGDTSRQDYDAASREKLYLKLELEEFYLLFGDYNTDLSDTQLSQYNRALTGIKSEYHHGGFDVVVFASESNQAFIRDEFRGKGISGPYLLSRQNIVMNTEQVIIETRDRFRSEIILEEREMARHTDYDIDYMKGTITFREPVFQNDTRLNHNFIIVKYESYDEDDIDHTYGGRVKKEINKHITVGVTHVNEGRVGGEARLSGVDATLHINADTSVHTEFAESRDSDNISDKSGDAFIAEIEHRAGKWDGRVYFNQTDAGFGLRQTNGSESGTRKIGIDTAFHPYNNLDITASAYQDNNLETDAKRNVIEAEAGLRIEQNTFRLGLRSVTDKPGDSSRLQSNQIIAGVSRLMLDGRLNVSIDREQSISSNESVDYPSVTRLSADYLLTEKTSLFVQHEWADGDQRETQYTQVRIKTRPWEGGEVFTGLKRSQDGTENTASADIALKQKWAINDFWSLDFGAEKSRTLSGSGVAPFNINVPFAHGSSSDYTAGSVGVTYNPGDWIWTSRVELRDMDSEDSWSVATSAQTDPGSDISLLSSLEIFDTSSDTGTDRSDSKLRLDLAYRPVNSPWIVLDKLELISETRNGGDFEYENRRIVNNVNANYYAIKRWQLALQLGIKYVQEAIDDTDYDGVINLYGAEARYDITEKWDIGAQVSTLHSLENSQFAYSAGCSISHSLIDNVWLSLGYNVVGFYDRDFSEGRSTSQGFYMKFRIKFDQESLKRPINKLLGTGQ